jgi:hypothetical protein
MPSPPSESASFHGLSSPSGTALGSIHGTGLLGSGQMAAIGGDSIVMPSATIVSSAINRFIFTPLWLIVVIVHLRSHSKLWGTQSNNTSLSTNIDPKHFFVKKKIAVSLLSKPARGFRPTAVGHPRSLFLLCSKPVVETRKGISTYRCGAPTQSFLALQ